MTGKKIRIQKWVEWGSILAIASIFSMLVIKNATNIPYYDDYDLLLGMIQRGIDGNFLEALFRIQNEHRVFTLKILPLLSYLITGNVDIRLPIYASVFILCGIFGLLYSINREKPHPFLSFSVAFLIFLPYGPGMLWASGTIAQYAAVFFSILTIFFLSKDSIPNFLGACFSFLLASFSLASGLLVGPIGLIFLLFQSNWRFNRNILMFGVLSFITIIWYTRNGVTPSGHPSLIAPLSDPIFFFKYYFVLSSSFLSAVLPLQILLFFSLILHGALLIILLKRWNKFSLKDPELFMIATIWASLLVIAISRAGFLSLAQATSDRYIIFSVTFWGLILTTLYKKEIIKEWSLAGVTLFICITYGITLWRAPEKLQEHHRQLIHGISQLADKQNPACLSYPDEKWAFHILNQALHQGYYQPAYKLPDSLAFPSPDSPINFQEILQSRTLEETPAVGFYALIDNNSPHATGINPEIVNLSGWLAANPFQGIPCEDIFVEISDPHANKSYYPAYMKYRNDVAHHFGHSSLAFSGFLTRIDPKTLPDSSIATLICGTKDKLLISKNHQTPIIRSELQW